MLCLPEPFSEAAAAAEPKSAFSRTALMGYHRLQGTLGKEVLQSAQLITKEELMTGQRDQDGDAEIRGGVDLGLTVSY